VVPGITRYHRSDCILIRFLGEDDLEHMTMAAAMAADFVACKACRPDQTPAEA
jgi:methylphosphotriester-DNA--protein-cysteine methyltransferase